LETRRLTLLLALARLGSMRAVAEELGYTTSTVSQQLGVLAGEVGATLLEREGRRVRFPLSPDVFARVSAWAGPPTQAELNRAIATRLRLSVAVGIVLLLLSLTRGGPGDRGSWSPMWLVVAAGVLLVVCGLAAQFHRRRGYFVVDGIGYALLGAQLVGRLAYGWTWGSAAVLTWAGLMILTAVAHFRRYRGTVDSE